MKNNILEYTQIKLNKWYADIKKDYWIIGEAKIELITENSKIQNYKITSIEEWEKKVNDYIIYLEENEKVDYIFNMWSEGL